MQVQTREYYYLVVKKGNNIPHKSHFTSGKIPFVLRIPNNNNKNNNNNKARCRPAHYVLAGKNAGLEDEAAFAIYSRA